MAVACLLLLATAAALFLPGVSGTSPDELRRLHAPTLEEMRERAMPWKKHLNVTSAWHGNPAGYFLKGLLTKSEVTKLVMLALEGMQKRQQARGNNHSYVPLDKLPELNASKGMRKLDERLSVLSGLPLEHIEEGYFTRYNTGHAMKPMHLDNHHCLFEPKRLISFVIYLVGEPELAGGSTVFPFVHRESANAEREVPAEEIAKWDSALAASRADFQLGKDPQYARTCSDLPAEKNDPLCFAAQETAKRLCAEAAAKEFDGASDSGGAAIRARPGDAVMFSNTDGDGIETVRALHGSCSIDQGTKLVLAKFLRSGPRPAYNEENKNNYAIATNKFRKAEEKEKEWLREGLDELDDEL